MKRYTALAFLLFSLVASAETEIKVSGSLDFGTDQFIEKDGNPWYSMNGEVFGKGDWKQSTTDNMNDNREKTQATLNLSTDIKVNNRVKLHLGMESMVDELIGKTNGSGETAIQEFSTIMDNPLLSLKDITAEIDSNIGKITLTNNLNYHFNSRVLTTQLDDNNGEPFPYGEGAMIEKDLWGYNTKGFVFQATNHEVDPNGGTTLVNGQNDITNATGTGDKLVYGAQIKKTYSQGKFDVLLVNEHDKTSEVQGANLHKKLDNFRIAVGGDYSPLEYVKVQGEVIKAVYGKDVTSILNSFGQSSWDSGVYDLSAAGAKDDTLVYDTSVTLTPLTSLSLSVGYKNVGEDYIAVLGNSQRMDSWLGKSSFDYGDGTGYEKGFNAKVNYTLPIDLLTKTTVEYVDYDMTRTALNNNEDDKKKELKGTVSLEGDKWKSEASYRRNTKTNSGSGTLSETNLLFNDYNLNGEYTILDKTYLKTKVNADLNYYKGDDNTLSQNFSNEVRAIIGTNTTYNINKIITLTGSYRFGYATEKNDVIHDGSAIQNLIKLGLNYKITNDISFDLMYKYDNYKLDVDATATELENSIYKKEAEHQWYDGCESWQHSGSHDWSNWPNTSTIAPGYKGYVTHEFKGSITIRF